MKSKQSSAPFSISLFSLPSDCRFIIADCNPKRRRIKIRLITPVCIVSFIPWNLVEVPPFRFILSLWLAVIFSVQFFEYKSSASSLATFILLCYFKPKASFLRLFFFSLLNQFFLLRYSKMNKLVILFVVFAVLGSIDAYTKVALENIRYLDLYAGSYTIGRKPVLQQQCVEDGARLCAYYQPNYLHCINSGSSRGQVIWRCEARLANGVRLGSLNVSTLWLWSLAILLSTEFLINWTLLFLRCLARPTQALSRTKDTWSTALAASDTLFVAVRYSGILLWFGSLRELWFHLLKMPGFQDLVTWKIQIKTFCIQIRTLFVLIISTESVSINAPIWIPNDINLIHCQ